MTCHNCRHNREIERLREICSKCRLGEEVAGDGSVSLDAIHDGTVDRVAKVAPNHPTAYTPDPCKIDEPQPEPDEATRTRDTLTTLLACVAALPYEQVGRLAILADPNPARSLFPLSQSQRSEASSLKLGTDS